MAALFVWVFIQDKTKNNKMLEDNTKMLQVLTESNNNIAKSLELLQKSMDNQYEFLQVHDKRCEEIEKSIEKIEVRMEDR